MVVARPHYNMAQSVSNEQKAEVARLILILRDKRARIAEPKRVVQAILRLGQLKAVQAIPDLAAMLTFRRTFEWEDKEGTLEIQPILTGNRYPASDALSGIGKSSLPVLVAVIADHEQGSLFSENALYTIRVIFRDEAGGAKKYLLDAAGNAATPGRKKRLAAAAQKAPATGF